MFQLVKDAFYHLNNYKRHRVLEDSPTESTNYHRLGKYKSIDQLELTLRAIQKEIRNTANKGQTEIPEIDEDDNDEEEEREDK